MKREGRIHKGVSIGAYSILIAFMLLLLWTVLRYPDPMADGSGGGGCYSVAAGGRCGME